MKKAKIQYENLQNASKPNQDKKISKSSASLPEANEETDGYVTIEEGEEEEESKEENNEEEKFEPKFAEISDDVKAIVFPPVKKPQIEYNLIKLRK